MSNDKKQPQPPRLLINGREASEREYRRIYRVLHCPWCWRLLGIMRFYPEHWSSTICEHHSQRLYAAAAARRGRK